MSDEITIKPYPGPAGGWGSAQSVTRHVLGAAPVRAALPLLRQNKPNGFACVSCAWAKPADHHPFEFCENGAKATAWELTSSTVGPEFFGQHTATELRAWPDHDLEMQGRLTHPLRFDASSDRWVHVEWAEAFARIGARLKEIDPRKAVFYTSGRAALETSYLYQLLARAYGSNNLPDSSNMCHETTSVALPKSIGVSVGTVRLHDFEATELILFFGQNVGSNSPRMLHQLQEVRERGVPIITFNPLRERGLERFTNPQNPAEMLLGRETEISTDYHQVTSGGDLAAITGLCKALLVTDDETPSDHETRPLDHTFIAADTHGFEPFADFLRRTPWEEIERTSGLARATLERVASIYARSRATIACYGMGLTQHRNGVETVQMLINLLLMRGNIGRAGAGILPVRGHSNVQGQRTVGITEKPELAPLDRLGQQYGFEPPRWKGMTTVDVCEGVLRGEVDAFVGLGGNFLRAVPDTARMEEAWQRIPLTVSIATKLNRTHLVNGRESYLLPCIGRLEIDRQASGPQAVSVEDSTACIHGSRGQVEPISPHLLSEPRIVAELARATLPANPRIAWDSFVDDYARIRDAIEETYPVDFARFNARLWQPGGFPRVLAARERRWETETGKANFAVPGGELTSHGLALADGVFRLITLRSNDQFNTTIYGYRDRFRGVYGTRMVLFINAADMRALGVNEGEHITLTGVNDDGVHREVTGLRVIAYDIPRGCVASYYPECNPLIPVGHHEREAKTPAAKSVPVTISKARASAPANNESSLSDGKHTN